jgi:putative tryptophan/tyrosine transport system substrate-binding protein
MLVLARGGRMSFDRLGRREFITLLGGAAAAWPLDAGAQQRALPVIGYLNTRTANEDPQLLDGFRQGLDQAGYVEGRNVAIEFRWADGQVKRLPDLAADLVRRRVNVIAALSGSLPAQAAKGLTSTTPIVFLMGGDPISAGLVASLNRPGGNVTGVAMLSTEMTPKKLELLHELLPNAKAMALLINPNVKDGETMAGLAIEAARILGLGLQVLYAGADQDFDGVFAKLAELQAGALLVSTNAFLNTRFEQIAARALSSRMATVFGQREAATVGGLMSYGDSLKDSYRLAGVFTGRILDGEKPTDLPVQQSTKIELVINLKTAKALGLTVPLALLTRADEVIE